MNTKQATDKHFADCAIGTMEWLERQAQAGRRDFDVAAQLAEAQAMAIGFSSR